jgi:glycosyltransferase involved in cell wall biosynthesis
MRTFVSICCQTYNHEQFIAQCLDGFVMQKTNFDFEILIHEDASTDNTASIIKEYESKYPQLFKCTYQTENQFLKQNTLTDILFPMAKGKYIALCEGDDYWIDPLKLQTQVDFLETHPDYSSCYHDVYRAYKKNNYDISNKEIYNNTQIKELYIEDLLLNKYSLIHTSSILFRAKLLPVPDWFQKISSGDIALFCLFANNGPIKRIAGAMSVYREHDGGITKTTAHNKDLAKNRIEFLTILDKHFNFKYTKLIQRTIEAFKNDQPVKIPLLYRIKRKLKTLL